MNLKTKFHLLKALADNPALSQRQLARELGISLGKANYCLHALIDKGLVKAENIAQHSNKTKFLYNLTPFGLEEKAKVTSRFLKQKLREYEDLKTEIDQLKQEAMENSLKQKPSYKYHGNK